MNLEKRIEALVYLGKQIELKDEQLQAVQEYSKHKNNWFTLENTNRVLEEIAANFLQKEKLEAWSHDYQIPKKSIPKTIGIIMGGYAPLEGFHDILSIFMWGHHAKIKLVEEDKFLLPHLIKILKEGFPEVENYFSFEERMSNFDAIIAKGTRDSVQTFKSYFSKYPNLIRKNRHGVAALFGKETKEELSNLGKDIFYYFGLSSRSISKIYIPQNYDFIPLLEATHEYNEVVLNNKYKNNFDYNYTLHIINGIDYKANGSIIIIEEEALQSRIATLHYEVFEDKNHLEVLLKNKKSDIQHIVSNHEFSNFKNKKFGEANQLSLTDYENEMDTMHFLKNLT